MTTFYLDPNSDISTPAGGTYSNIDDGVRAPTDPTTGGDGVYNLYNDKDDNNDEDQFGCETPVGATGTVTAIYLKFYSSNAGGGDFIPSGNIRVNGTWQTAQSYSEGGGWTTLTFTGSWNAATLTNMGMAFSTTDLANGESHRINAAYLEFDASGGGSDDVGPEQNKNGNWVLKMLCGSLH